MVSLERWRSKASQAKQPSIYYPNLISGHFSCYRLHRKLIVCKHIYTSKCASSNIAPISEPFISSVSPYLYLDYLAFQELAYSSPPASAASSTAAHTNNIFCACVSNICNSIDWRSLLLRKGNSFEIKILGSLYCGGQTAISVVRAVATHEG